jgi:hypothetical protein
MKTHAYLVLSGLIFGLVALGHLLRVLNAWPLTCGPWTVPMALSWLGTIGPALLCAWALTLARRSS